MTASRTDTNAREEGAPPGWTSNPSSWEERLPIVALAMVGFFISLYLGLFQLEVFSTVWEPFFGDGSRTILDSRISHLLPIPDALLGAAGYFLDAATGVIGGKKRWRTMPWIVIIFGLFIGPFGVVSIALVMSQPIVLDAWCTLCLGSAVISLVMIGPAVDEMLASLQYLRRERDRGNSVKDAFLGRGDTSEPEVAVATS
ncbi:MAG: vitamin K epoxide reductase family protein [Thermomicrobiales bacterium]